MSTIVIKNLPDGLHESLKQQARQHHRSVTKEVVSLIEQGMKVPLKPFKLSPPLKLAGGYRPTIEDIEAAIAEGRERNLSE